MANVCMVVCLLLAALSTLGGALQISSGELAASQLSADFSSCKGVSEAQPKCLKYVRAGAKHAVPSPACCEAIRNADVECGCKHITPEYEKTISWPLVLLVTSYCQRPFKPGSTCGSFVVP